jgi:hypothetical protein
MRSAVIVPQAEPRTARPPPAGEQSMSARTITTPVAVLSARKT